MMAETEAWTYLAVRWGAAQLTPAGYYATNVGAGQPVGLCCSILNLSLDADSIPHDHCAISEHTRELMFTRVRAYDPEEYDSGSYFWPLRDPLGAIARAEFCLQAALDSAVSKPTQQRS